jgi:hypothetical protein
MQISRNYFLSTALRTVAAITLIAGMAGIMSSTAQGQSSEPLSPDVGIPAKNRSWTAAGATGTVDDDSTASARFNNFAITLQTGATGPARIRYNITAVDGMNSFCPATSSTVNVRFRSSEAAGNNVKFDIKYTNILTGGSTVLYSFNSNGIGAGNAFTTATATPAIDFDFAQNVYWIDATLSRINPAAFADLGSIQIWESAGTPCP